MAGNREAYEKHMNAGYNAAWDQNWQAAIKAYTGAIQEFPEDAEAHNQLGLALLQAERLDDALKVYTRAHQLSPEDPAPLEKSADVLQRLGRLKEAAQQYVNVADVFLAQKDIKKAITNWERATALTPGLIAIHAKLAQAYERVGNKRKAVYHYMMLAYNFNRVKEKDKAVKAVDRSLRLDKRNSHALNMRRAILADSEVFLPKDESAPEPVVEDESTNGKTGSLERDHVGEADPLGPMGEALSDALVALAAFVVESGTLDAAGADALQAMELQRQNQVKPAIDAYLRAESKLRHPALRLNLGVLQLLDNQPGEAVKNLGEAVMDPKLAAGALHALGKANYDLGKNKPALRYLIQSLQAVDTKLAIDDEEVTELSDVYNRLLDTLNRRPDEALAAANDQFLSLLSGKDWKQRIGETRRHLAEVMHEEDEEGAADIIVTPDGGHIPAAISRIDTYIRQGLLTLAMDEAHRTVESAPLYLPVHVRMAEIMMREGRVRQAINKYNVVARSYMTRSENDRAASILSEVLEMAPLDVSIRTSLIELLESEDRMEEVLDQYIRLAGTYNQLGNFDLARESFTGAERLARRISAPSEKLVQIKHRLADMDQMRLDTRRALKSYEEIIELKPEDERALRMLVDLNYNIGNQVEAIRRLDTLMSIYAHTKQTPKILRLLEDMVKSYQNDTGLRSRLARTYEQLGRNEEAIEQWDALGELQLEAGDLDDARNTIEQIIALDPPGIDEYRKLLAQLGG